MKRPLIPAALALSAALLTACGSSHDKATEAASAPIANNLADLLKGAGGSGAGGSSDLEAIARQLLGADSVGLAGGLGAGGGLQAPAQMPAASLSPQPAPPVSEQKPVGDRKSADQFIEIFGKASMRVMFELDSSVADEMSTADCNCRQINAQFIAGMRMLKGHIKPFTAPDEDPLVTRTVDGYRYDVTTDTPEVPIYDDNDKVIKTVPARKDVKSWVVIKWISGEWKASEVGSDAK